MSKVKEVTYEVRGFKLAGGDETPRFEASLYRDGKRIGTVHNEGCGGPHGYYFDSREEREAFFAWTKAWGLKSGNDFEPEDAWVYEQLEAHEERQWLLRQSRKKTLFRLHGDKEGAWRTIKFPYSEKVQEYLDTKYGDQIETIFRK